MIVQNLSYKHNKNAPYFFHGLSFSLEKGKIHALHGKNGVGKTILFNILHRMTDKNAIVSGEIIANDVCLMNQRFDQTLADQFTFLENLHFAHISAFPSLLSTVKKKSIFCEIIEKFNIDPAIPVYRLSGGQRQILALLMKLQKQPQNLLLDEPTATLDQQNAILVFEFLKTLKDVTIFTICHDKDLIHRYANGQHLHLVIESNGIRKLAADELAQQIFAMP